MGIFRTARSDLNARTLETLQEIESLVLSRNSSLGFARLPSRAEKSGYMENIIGHFQTRAEEQIRLFSQGRLGQSAFKTAMAQLFLNLAAKLEGDRSRKNAILRHEIDAMLRVAAAVTGVGFGSARLVASFE